MSEKEPNGKRPPRKRIPKESNETERKSFSGSKISRDGDNKKAKPGFGRDRSTGNNPKSFGSRDGESRRPFERRDGEAPRDRKPYGSRDGESRKPFERRDSEAPRDRKPYGSRDGESRRPFERRDGEAPRERKPYGSRDGESRRPFERRDGEAPRDRKPYGSRDGESRRPFERRDSEAPRDRKPYGSRDGESRRPFEKKDGEAIRRGGSFDRQDRESYADKRKGEDDPREHRPARRNRFDEKPQVPGRAREPKDQIRLNKYLADAGICSRREADLLIQAGTVTVNGEVVTTLGTKVGINDKVNYGGQTLKREKLRYVLLNKPKGYITTSDDPYDRKTVMELVQHACEERIYPVGRLDRNTLGLLLLTNDGDLAKRLMHPRHGVKKLYHVELDKPLTRHDMLQIAEGLDLEDGKAEVDAISYVSKDESKKEIGIEIHSGKNRIVRRIFEHLGYKVEKLDRVMLAGLTKLDLPRGKYRHLTPPEVSLLMRIK